MKFIKNHWLALLLLAIPFAFIAYYWNQLPAEIPLHWNAKGEVDRTSDSPYAVFTLPVINLLVFATLFLIPVLDPKRMTAYFKQTMKTVITVIVGLLSTLSIFTTLNMVGVIQEMDNIFQIVLSIFFLIVGNYLGKIRPNYFLGIRTPWTLEHESVWVQTHRMAGVLWVVASLLMLALTLLLPLSYSSNFFLGYIFVLAFVPAIYSFILYKQLPNESTESR